MKKFKINTIYNNDSLKLLSDKSFVPDNSIDLIITSPPYADRRKKNYGGPPPSEYVEWFMPFANEFRRVLKPKGSFILNIKENANRGERHTYVLELILEIRKSGWLWTEDYIWHKKNAFPGKWPNRFRDSWEHCLHFTKNKDFHMYQDDVKVPIGDWANKRLKKLGTKDKVRTMSQTDSGFGRQLTNWVGRSRVYPSNVLHLPTISSNKNHCAVFPEALPSWFIKLFTRKEQLILDPFIGSGTTAIAALKLQRNFVGIDTSKKYCEIAKAAVLDAKKLVKIKEGRNSRNFCSSVSTTSRRPKNKNGSK